MSLLRSLLRYKTDIPQVISELFVIGASTGGPGAVLTLISTIPLDVHMPIIVIQHIEGAFIEGYATWLASELRRKVSIAKAGCSLKCDTVYVANACGNLELSNELTFRYVPASNKQLYTPNINHFFNSISNLSIKAHAALLTGMGDDGASGLKKLADCGWHTYVQEPKSCVVSGMPDAAIKLSSRHQISTLQQISRFIQIHSIANNKGPYGRTK